MEMEKFKEIYPIKNFNVDFRGNLKIATIFDFCQDLAEAHASKLDIGYAFCKERNIAWVLTGFRFVIHKIPHWNNDLKASTWPSKTTKLICRRDYSFSVNDEVCVSAAAHWINLDTIKHRPLAISANIPNFPTIDEFAVEGELSKISLPSSESMHFQKSFEVLISNIDVNNHVNNSVYALWACEAMGIDWQKSKQLKEMEINFKNQTFMNEEVHISASIEGNKVVQSLYKLVNNEEIEVARIQSSWEDVAI